MDLPPKPPDSTDPWDRPWPQTRCEVEALVDACLDRLVRYAYSRLGNLQDAEDVVQEVFMRSLSDRSERAKITMIGPYLYRSVANACTDLVRKRGSGIVVRREIGIDEMPDRGESPSGAAEAAEEIQRAERLLGQLPQVQADVVLMQAPSYNKMIGPMAEKMGKIVYTSPNGIKVLSSSRDKWLAGILLQSAQASIGPASSKEMTGYLLQTPAGTFPALAVNGAMTDDELHALIDGLVPAKEYVKSNKNGDR